MDSLEQLRKQKMQQYANDAAMQQSFAEQQLASQQAELEAQMKSVLSQVLTREALERISNIKAVKPEFAMQVQLYLVQLFRAGQLQPMVTDNQLKALLDQLVQKRETKIIRK